MAPLGYFAAFLEVIVIIPAVLVERIGDQRRAQDPLNLLLGHAGPHLLDHGLVEVIALADRDLVKTGQIGFAASGQNQQQDAGGA